MSRQVRAEAEHIFHNENLFVLVTLNLELDLTFRYLIEPFVLAIGEIARSFKHHAVALDLNFSRFMSFFDPIMLTTPDTPECRHLHTPTCFVIAGVDMPWLVRALGTIDGLYEHLVDPPLLQNTCLSISALGPLEGAATREDGRPQDYHRLRKVLEPLHHLHGMQQACLDANVSAEYKQNLIASIERPQLSIEASVEKATTFIMTGDEAFRCRHHLEAIYAYQDALDCLPYVNGLLAHWSHCGYVAQEMRTDIFFNIVNRLRAARIRLEIGRKALEPALPGQSRANRLNKSARAGADYAVDHFSHSPWRTWGDRDIYVVEYWRNRVGLDVQLGIIKEFESERGMKKALRTLRFSMKNDPWGLGINAQFPWGKWDGWLVEI